MEVDRVEMLNLGTTDFAQIFGTTVDEIVALCGELISSMNFSYYKISGEDRDKILLNVLKDIDNRNFSISGKERKSQWEKGWGENLTKFEKDYDLAALVPKYSPCERVLRFRGNYIRTANNDFEQNYYTILRTWLFKKYLNDVSSIHEFGCGPGHNLVMLAKLFPNKKLYGSDWTVASTELINKIAKVYGYNLAGVVFDMFEPREDYNLESNSAILTIGSLEQLGEGWKNILQFFMKKNPKICVHWEPFYELYDEMSLFDYPAMKYHQRRGYLKNYLTQLKKMESQKMIEILNIRRVYFGNIYHEGSLVVWKLK